MTEKPHLPAFGIFPIKIKSVKVVLLNESDDIFDELLSGGRIVDQSRVLVALGVVPASDSNSDLDPARLVSSNLPIKIYG